MSELKPMGKAPKKATEEKIKAFKRKMEKSAEVHHDLFRLDDAITRKNVSYDDKNPNWQPLPHRHFYHSVSSDGRPLKNSAPSAGHYHEVKIIEGKDGIERVECGPPMVLHKGKSHPYKNDNHTHEISYLVSEVVQRRVKNNDAIKVMSQLKEDENAADKGVAGILGRG